MHVSLTNLENETFRKISTISFGTAATIKAKGMFVGKVAAEISRNGKAHVIKTGGMLCSVKVNDNSNIEHTLTINDRILTKVVLFNMCCIQTSS